MTQIAPLVHNGSQCAQGRMAACVFFPLDWFQPQTPFTSSHPAFPSLRVPLNSTDGALIVPLALLLLLWPKHHSSRELGLGPSACFSVDQVCLVN